MPTREELYTALRNADASGDVEGARKLASYIKTMPAAAPAASAPNAAERHISLIGSALQGAGNLLAGGLRGAGSIGATLLWPADKLSDIIAGDRGPDVASLITGKQKLSRNEERRAAIDDGLRNLGAQTDSLLYRGGKVAGEIAGTAGAGGLVARGAAAALPALSASPAGAAALEAIASGGLRAGGLTGLPGLGVRALGGAVNGTVSAGMVDPKEAAAGGVIGAAVPVAAKGVTAALGATGRALRGNVSDQVKALAQRAEELGINVPVDRITNSKPLNALASSLNYVPFSGRAATEHNMQTQLNRALSRTFGQDSDNVTMALRQAGGDLGQKFDQVLSSNKVRIDQQFLSDLGEHEAMALRELPTEQAGVIKRQIDEILNAGATGEIDGQAAYNIKRVLDRIGKRSTPEAYYATQLKKSLMGALDRSLSPEEAQAFAQTRQQYGNMLSLEGLAQNGAEGDISIGRLANMKNIGNKDLQELADIAAQFLKSREGNHGAWQRAAIGTGVTASAGLPTLGGTIAAGRALDAVLKSQKAKQMVLDPARIGPMSPELQLLLRTAPVVGTQ